MTQKYKNEYLGTKSITTKLIGYGKHGEQITLIVEDTYNLSDSIFTKIQAGDEVELDITLKSQYKV